jgi:hypothetical protein
LLNWHLWLSGINCWTALDVTERLGDLILILWLGDDNMIWQWLLWSDFALKENKFKK